MLNRKGVIRRGVVEGKINNTYKVIDRYGVGYYCQSTYFAGKNTSEENFNRPNGVVLPYTIGDLVLFTLLDTGGLEIENEYVETELATGFILGKINTEEEHGRRFPILLTDDLFIRTRTGAGLYFNHVWNTDTSSLISNGTANGHMTLIANKGHMFFGKKYLPFGLWINQEESYTPPSSYLHPPEISDNEVLLLHQEGSYLHLQEDGKTQLTAKSIGIRVSDDVGVDHDNFVSITPSTNKLTVLIDIGGNTTSIEVSSDSVDISSSTVNITADTVNVNGSVHVQ